MDSRLMSEMKDQNRTLQREIRFQQMVLMFFQNFIFSDHEDPEAGEELSSELEILHLGSESLKEQWHLAVSKFLVITDQELKPNLQNVFVELLGRFPRGCSCREYDISGFIQLILLNLKVLVVSKPHMIAPVKKQIGTLEETLEFVSIISHFAFKGINIDEKLLNFLEYIQPWVNSAAAVAFVYWVDQMDENLCIQISPFLQKFHPGSPELVEVYLGAVRALNPSEEFEILLKRKAVWRFLRIILENLVVHADDSFEMIYEGLVFFTAFLMDPPQEYVEDGKLILTQTNLLVHEAGSLICSLWVGKLKEDISEGRNTPLHDLLEKIDRAKAEVRQLHVEIPGLSWNNVPHTNRQGFFDFLLGNLMKKLEAEADLFPFEKHLIAIVQKELMSLRHSLMDMFELQDDHEEIKSILVQASNVAYLVDYVTDSCLSIDAPIWSNLIYLSNATEEIQFLKTKVTKIRETEMYKPRVSSARMNSRVLLPEQANAKAEGDVKVIFTNEEERTIDRLTRGEAELDIVAIVGMPGQGKTTLAWRVFHDSGVRLHFNKHAWCCISQAYDIKEILIDILNDVDEPVPKEQVPYVSQEDLAEQLYRCLKGRRYLIVLDDIWDIKAWYELQLSFPDDNNGSRILLTSRIRNVALEAKPGCCLVELHPLSYEESWNLLRMKLFEEDACPPILSDMGKKIAENCKGLPLAIVLIAGLLKKEKNVDSWKRIAESLNSQIATEGCMNILELSYIHLPDFLKPCFLYLGAFREDQVIDTKKLIQLWIAEGFIQNDGTKSVELVANEYLINLVSRSLVFVAKRSSRYGIKKCRVHDLLHAFCLIKAKEDRFLLVPNVSDHSSSIKYEHYRLCVHSKWGPFVDSQPIVPSVRSLLVSGSWEDHLDAPSFFTRFKLLRVLDLESVNLNSAFDAITQLIHLRFLSVACHIDIPPSIVNLSRLEVFRLTPVATAGFLPSVMMKMENLRHISIVSGELGYTVDDDELELSPPLTNLETFTLFNYDERENFERQMRKLPNVRKLGLILSFCVRLSSYFNKLESLNLFISVYMSPSTFDFPSTLKKLSLTGPTVSGIMISSIGKLSNLEVLKLEVGFGDQRWDVEDDEFLNLKYLKISFSDIQEWNASDESFPCLEQVVLKRCEELQELPYRLGVISTLTKIEVRKCNAMLSSSFQQIVDDQRDSGNEGLQISHC